jgi:transcriptional regulator with XRE-family HTH domain
MTRPTLAEAVRLARADVRMGLRELARRSGVAAGVLSRIEHGKLGAGPGTVRRIARATGCDASYLLLAAIRTRAGDLLAELRAERRDLEAVPVPQPGG